MENIVNKNDKNQLHGIQIGYYNNNPGQIAYKKNYINGEYHGEQLWYYSNGKIMYKYYYINGDLVSNEEWIAYDRKIKMNMISNL
jgi:antitoxin component YwqK of YwqJK toxin-antitoxin module